ncbi:helix-turn-helix domain-containing protein [Streptomyces sp. SCA3-4]|uniref:helix-turn-helix domain-containing protein n=1 Tax=Streptomyces sichuanensis TaxID=2871810 RepID=UPI001CE38ED4|nr:helix-turn-helix domain-containing protein [Streptomyces sichuanensis]MCA6092198.1 helix-turn-helix domain-containing protein [Streptomyces sichuanensis]
MASEFSALLRRLRRDAGMTQETLAERAGVGVRTIRGLETGERADPRVTTVRLLADALGLSPEDREELLAAAVRRPGHADGDGADGPSNKGAPPDGSAGHGDRPDGPTEHDHRPDARPVRPVAERPGSVLQEALADVGEQLAQAVAARWQREEEHRQVHDPYPLPLRWQPAPEELTDHWANIRRLPAGVRHGPLELSGRLDEIVGVYGRIPSGRLVVLGRPGSGKTILAVRFVLDHLKSRARTHAVPVIFSIGSWDPTAITFRDWLARQLTRDHPGLAAPGPAGPSLAAALVESGRVLPVLDGFDEIAGGLRRPALEALNATTLPLVLTSRPSEYAAAVAETDVLTSAAAVSLIDLTLGDLADYLPRTTRKARGGDPARTAWDPVLSELGEQGGPGGPGEQRGSGEHGERPHSRAGANLAAVLTTPLMVTLARAVYSDTPGHDPVSLLDTRRFGSPEELEEHLLDNFVATVYRPRPEHHPGSGPRRDVDPERARYWLGYLAHHLTRLDTPNLEWWRLGSGLRRSTRTLVTALLIALTTGLVDCGVGSLFDSLGFQIPDALAVGTIAGLMFGVTYWFMVAAKDTAVAPSGVRMKMGGRDGKAVRRAVRQLVIGLVVGLVFGFGYGFIRGVHDGFALHLGPSMALRAGLYDGMVYGLAFTLAAGPAFGLLGLLETPLDIRSAINPVSLLRGNCRTVTAQLLVWAPTFGLLVGFGAGVAIRFLPALLGPIAWNTVSSIKMGLISGLCGALSYSLSLTAWGQWVVFSRIWLPLTGRLPWSVVGFLEDAYERGVLRQAGAVYQFRHARLQDHLARTYRASRAPRRPERGR